jgi:hypothetical protein
VIPVDQTLFAGERDPSDPDSAGNCMQAAFASLLELPLDEVPHFLAPEDWWGAICEWVLEQGYCIAVTSIPLAALGIMSGRSPRGPWNHAVVSRGDELVHDPHPSRAGVLEPFEWWYLIPHDPVARLRDLVRGVFEREAVECG